MWSAQDGADSAPLTPSYVTLLYPNQMDWFHSLFSNTIVGHEYLIPLNGIKKEFLNETNCNNCFEKNLHFEGGVQANLEKVFFYGFPKVVAKPGLLICIGLTNM